MVKPTLHCIPYNWVFVIPITTSLFALIFFSNSVFSCASFSAATETGPSFQYGYWGFQYEYGECHSFDVVDGLMRLGRTLGIVGFMIGILIHFLLTFLCCMRAPKHIIASVSATMMGMVFFAFTVFFGAGTHFCKVRDGTYDCQVTVNGYLVLMSALLWFVGGFSLRFVKDRFDDYDNDNEKARASAPEEDETWPSDNLRKNTSELYQRDHHLDTVNLEAGTRSEHREKTSSDKVVAKEVDEEIPKVVQQQEQESEESTVGAASKTSSPSVVIEREHLPDGRQIIRTTKTCTRPDGTQVIEKDTVTKPRKRTARVKTSEEKPGFQWICDDLNQCSSSDNYHSTTAQDFLMSTTASGLTDDTPHKDKVYR